MTHVLQFLIGRNGNVLFSCLLVINSFKLKISKVILFISVFVFNSFSVNIHKDDANAKSKHFDAENNKIKTQYDALRCVVCICLPPRDNSIYFQNNRLSSVYTIRNILSLFLCFSVSFIIS